MYSDKTFLSDNAKVEEMVQSNSEFLKTVAFIAGKSENQAAKFFFIHFSIDNISFYALSWLKLNFGCYLTFEIIF